MRSGTMTYQGDILLPMIAKEVDERLVRFQGLSAAEESAMLSLSSDQKRIILAKDLK
jgi:hypothetical protein